MDVQLKDMKLVFTVSGSILTREVKDLNDTLIWSNDGEHYESGYGPEFIDEYETQMKQLTFWNIVQVEKNI